MLDGALRRTTPRFVRVPGEDAHCFRARSLVRQLADSNRARSRYNAARSDYGRLRLLHLVYRPLHVETLLRLVIMFSFENFLEPADGFFQCHVFTGRTGECFCDEERL